MLSPAVIVAIITFFSGGLLEFIRRGFDGKEKKNSDLTNMVKDLQIKVDKLIDEVDRWKTAYYQLMIDLLEREERLVRTEEVLVETEEALAVKSEALAELEDNQ